MFRRIICGLSILSALVCGWPILANAQSVTKEQIHALLPGEQDLQGFTHVFPGSRSPHSAGGSAGETAPDAVVEPDADMVIVRDDPSTNSRIWFSNFDQVTSIGATKSLFESVDNNYDLSIEVILCDTPEVAKGQLAGLHRLSSVWQSGTLTGSSPIGDEALVSTSGGRSKTLAFRYGRLIAVIEGNCSEQATSYRDFPSVAIEAVAYQILLRASQQSALVKIPALDTHLAVNAHALPKSVLRVAGQTYVPVAEFAKAMGLTSRWDTKTGALTLSGAGRKTVTLTVGSKITKNGTVNGTALTVPVLKQAGEPVMTLADLLTVTGGRIVGHSGNTVQVKG